MRIDQQVYSVLRRPGLRSEFSWSGGPDWRIAGLTLRNYYDDGDRGRVDVATKRAAEGRVGLPDLSKEVGEFGMRCPVQARTEADPGNPCSGQFGDARRGRLARPMQDVDRSTGLLDETSDDAVIAHHERGVWPKSGAGS